MSLYFCGFTALHFAAREGDLESTRLLLAAGVDVNVRSQPEPSETGPATCRTA
jgi:ankyrin repeat protein